MEVGLVTLIALNDWLGRLGYIDEPQVLHRRGGHIPDTHPYAPEIKALLQPPEDAVRAHAVFDIEGVPTVVFVGDDEAPLAPSNMDRIRQKIWNQNLATVVIELNGKDARAFPARKLAGPGNLSFEELSLDEARPDGPFSALDIVSANLSRRLPSWFDMGERVDRKLLKNIAATISKLSRSGFDENLEKTTIRRHAELLMGQLLFISYLEHREIVGETYRDWRSVRRLHDLVANSDREGIQKLIYYLRQDFNGDFLDDDSYDPWSHIVRGGYDIVEQFLSRTDMETGQGDFWNYDFSCIPVELISGLYESFLSPVEKDEDSAYYTPRHLAMLAVDQAFARFPDDPPEKIFDGACGSGILLTTAFRRLISLFEGHRSSRLSLKERIEILTKRIFGADINMMACRVTAFSLYLSLLEGLDPADIKEAQEHDNVKLPKLDGINLLHGNGADFFDPNHGFMEKRFDLLISNPPWKELLARRKTSADKWVKSVDVPFPLRQIAGAYTLRSLDFLSDSGRICLILPMSQFLGRSSTPFVSYFFKQVKPIRLINFGDLQNLLFPTTENTCHIFLGTKRRNKRQNRILFDETFDYFVPKADISLRYGRLTMQSADRRLLQTLSVLQDPEMLITLMWGDTNDLALWTRLTTIGTFGDFWTGLKATQRWVCRKGVHLKDQSREAVSSTCLGDMLFVPPTALRRESPLLHSDRLTSWPKNHQTVVGINEDLMRVFDGPRVLFTDGFSKQDLSIRAAYFDRPATFTSSIGVIAGPEADKSLLQFAAVYLRSSLARYFLMMRGWKMLCQRDSVHLTDVRGFPFFEAAAAPNPETAKKALDRITQRIEKLSQLAESEQIQKYELYRHDFDNDVYDFFSLSNDERSLVNETVDVFLPSIRPRSFKSLDTPAQKPAGPDDFERYANALVNELSVWRERTGGKGYFHVSIETNEAKHLGSIGVVRIEHTLTETASSGPSAIFDDQAVQKTLSELRQQGLTIIPSGDAIQLIPDTHIWINGALYIVRLLVRRNWTLRRALQDAEHIVRTVQDRQMLSSKKKVA